MCRPSTRMSLIRRLNIALILSICLWRIPPPAAVGSLAKLDQFNGDFRTAEMVKAFIDSPEYRARFGNP